MRVGTSLLFFGGKCFQSYEWSYFRPLGGLQNAINILDEYQIDEISIIRPVRQFDTVDLFEKDMAEIKNLKSMTPISLGGGIRSEAVLEGIRDVPIERLVLSSSFIEEDISLIEKVIGNFGRQALQLLLPVKFREGKLFVYNCNKSQFISIDEVNMEFCVDNANEIIIHDVENEGESNSFNFDMLDYLHIPYGKLIISGGIGGDTTGTAREKKLAAVMVENRILHAEYSVGRYRNG